MSLNIGVVVISKNEECDLRGFLDHLLPWVDEIVLVDDESTDSSLEIARAAGPKVRIVERAMDGEGGFAAQRNAGIDAAQAEWLLHMDVDERVTPELAREIAAAVRNDAFDAYRYRRLNFFLHHPMRGGGWQRWNNPQLARRGRHRFEKPIHEQCVVAGRGARTGQLSGYMWHLNDQDYVERVSKNLRYMQMTGRNLVEQGMKVRWYHFLVHPVGRAIRSYLFDGGYREGTRGLLFAMYTLTSVFNGWACAWESQNRIPRERLEEQLRAAWREVPDVAAMSRS